MILLYKSKGGTVEMGGGNSPLINISKISGLELPPRRYETIEFTEENGITTIGQKDGPRTITITGDLLGGQREIMRALKVFYYNGELICKFGQIDRKISCKCINIEDMERRINGQLSSFTVQLQADYPYFNDINDTTVFLAEYRNLIIDTFTLPCVFTEMSQGSKINNIGDMICFPIIKLTAITAPGEETAYIKIENATTGAVITLNYVMENEEEIEIDLTTRRITSNFKGNITHCISDDTNLSKSYLDLGMNEILFETSGNSQQLIDTLTFNNIYLMAVR